MKGWAAWLNSLSSGCCWLWRVFQSRARSWEWTFDRAIAGKGGVFPCLLGSCLFLADIGAAIGALLDRFWTGLAVGFAIPVGLFGLLLAFLFLTGGGC